MKIVTAILLLIFSALGFVLYSYLFSGCDVPLEYQKERLLVHLKKNGLSEQYLSYDKEGSTECRPSFVYKSKTEHIHYVLVDGGNITSWNFNEQ
ncbi:hypothetical protein [Pleionea sediminis]|uniref:hypothetical protein n=1 Tax=Pleionea sediminis TaxID=2569479 RepID=UPI0011855477|nr:hypothetical protein [Pleionea sediminis]